MQRQKWTQIWPRLALGWHHVSCSPGAPWAQRVEVQLLSSGDPALFHFPPSLVAGTLHLDLLLAYGLMGLFPSGIVLLGPCIPFWQKVLVTLALVHALGPFKKQASPG